MISDKKHIGQLAAILLAKGVSDVVISPGSRNSPLIHTFVGCGKFHCYSIVDERSAAYFAIGLSQALRKPVVIVCSSGTAALNYASGVAEAFYLNVPLIAITADRPGYRINQMENQCIVQNHIYQDFTAMGVTLPLGESETELWHAGRLINECLNKGKNRPVHINIPLEEPLNGLTEDKLPDVKIIDIHEGCADIPALPTSCKVMILAGQQLPDTETSKLISELIDKHSVVVLKEHLANIHCPQSIGNLDLLMSFIKPRSEDFRPDLLITLGGHIVSKSLNRFLKINKPVEHWIISTSNDHSDTYQALTKIINTPVNRFLRFLIEQDFSGSSAYLKEWKQAEQKVTSIRQEYCTNLEFCDMFVFNRLSEFIPNSSVIHLGNSTPVRYALMEKPVPEAVYMGNRGVSGIDGSLSTAVGYANASDCINTIILGDLSFFYDSNALWNSHVPENLRIVVINNDGGNIFKLIDSPEKSPAFRKFIHTENKFKAEGIAKTFGINYLCASNKEEMDESLNMLYSQKGTAILEVFTNSEINSVIFKKLLSSINNFATEAEGATPKLPVRPPLTHL